MLIVIVLHRLKAKIVLNTLSTYTNIITSRTSGEMRMSPEAPVAQVGEKSARSCSFLILSISFLISSCSRHKSTGEPLSDRVSPFV